MTAAPSTARAHCPGDQAGLFEAGGSSFGKEVSRDAAVFLSGTAAIHGADVKSDNLHRHEDSDAARALDDRLRQVWERHSRFHFIPSERSFMKTITHGLKTITGVLESVKGGGPRR